MSRCFPFPPPGYNKNNGGRGTRLIFSFKVKKESDKKERKEKHREKKEKKREKRSRKNGTAEEKKQSWEERHKDERSQNAERREESKHLEKSALTEEHGHAADYQYLCDSSDSIHDGGKRKKQKMDSDASFTCGGGQWIRLPSLKNNERQGPKKQACSDSLVIFQQARTPTTASPSTATTTVVPVRQNNVLRSGLARSKSGFENRKKTGTTAAASDSSVIFQQARTPTAYAAAAATPTVGLLSKNNALRSGLARSKTGFENREKPGSTAAAAATAHQSSVSKIGSARPVTGLETQQTEIDQLKELIETWVLPIQTEYKEFCNQEWLFEKHQSHRKQGKGWEGSKEPGHGCCGLRSSACYLSEAGVYALPFVLPY